MQQMYSCPNCGAQVTYGQPDCHNCGMSFNWPTAPVQGQYQSVSQQYANQQEQWNQQQWQQAYSSNQQMDSRNDQDEVQEGSALTRLLEMIQTNAKIIALILAAVVIVFIFASLGFAFQGVITKLVAKPLVNSFTVSDPSITMGQEATLQWDVSGAGSVIIEPGIGKVASSGNMNVSPDTRTTYALTASNLFGSANKSLDIDVTGIPPSIISFDLNSDSIYSGQSATLTWNVQNATSVSISPEIGSVTSSGSKSVSPHSNTRYVITATNSAGNVTASKTLTINDTNKPIITIFRSGSESINSGEITTLTWDVIGAKSINITQGIGRVASKGSMDISPKATTTYILMAESDYGTETSSATVIVVAATTTAKTIQTDPPVINSFKVSQNSIMLTDEVTLTWTVTGARGVSISNDIGTVPSSGWTKVIPTATTTYTLYATNTFGTKSADVTVNVNKATSGGAPVIRFFKVIPNNISSGETATLSWATENATMLLIDHGIGIPASKFSHVVSPTENTTYTLTALNSADIDTASVTVTVEP